jgi:hypothetical protein
LESKLGGANRREVRKWACFYEKFLSSILLELQIQVNGFVAIVMEKASVKD